MDCNQHNQHSDSVETCLVVRQGVRARWVFAASIACFTTGYLVGSTFQRFDPDQPRITDSPSAGSLKNSENTTPELIAKYQEEVVRLTRSRQRDSDKLRENQLLLREMNRRGVDSDSASCRRLIDETQQLTNTVVRNDKELASASEQLAKLTEVRNATNRQHDGIDALTEVDARRVVMEHDAGLRPK